MKFFIDRNWVLGEPALTCNEVCSKTGRYCNSNVQSNLITDDLVAEKMLEAGYTCKKFFAACRSYAGTPFFHPNGDECVPICPGSRSVCNGNLGVVGPDTGYYGARALCFCEEST